jgi:hypothetical protein
MRQNFHSCASLLLLAAWLWGILTSWMPNIVTEQLVLSEHAASTHEGLTNQAADADAYADAESLLARGERLPLACLAMPELELIKGISDATALTILAARPAVLGSRASPEEALAGIQGVGITKARYFAQFLTLTPVCRGLQSAAGP